MKTISVISAVLNEESNVLEVHRQIKDVFERIAGKYDYEHIFLDNGSTDHTVDILREMAARDKRVKVLVHSKNFGPMASTMNGYRHASGDAVICYEANLKDPPELILTFIEYWEQGYDVIYGIRDKTKDPAWLLFMRKFFYRLVNAFANEELPKDAGDFRLVDRKVVQELIKLEDYKQYIRGLIASIGFKQKGVVYQRRARPAGKSKSSIGHLIDFAINAIISYSILPIRLCTYWGLGLAVLSFLSAIVYVILKLTVWEAQIPALAGVIVILLLFSGIQLFFIGVIGEYVCAIHAQVRKKPFVVIQEKINFDDRAAREPLRSSQEMNPQMPFVKDLR